MKFTVSMKDPDTLSDAIEEAVKNDVDAMGFSDSNEADALKELRVEKVYNLCRQWFRYGEYLAVEIDTEAGTCTVLPVDR